LRSRHAGDRSRVVEYGIVFPHHEIGTEPSSIREFAQAVEGLGFTHLLIYDHVVGADSKRPGGWSGPYDKDVAFHEPFVTFGYIAAVTRRIELVTAVLVLPQRQTALVAKQAAEVDLLSGGRLRLGIGTGWNEVEYEALSASFRDRGRRQEEQVELLRALWREDSLTFRGKYHTVTQAGINPRPRREIPIWFGGSVDAVLRRAARLGQGWLPIMAPNDAARDAIGKIKSYLVEEGRSFEGFGVQAQAQIRGGDVDRWRRHRDHWAALGATHLAVATQNAALADVADHLRAAERYLRAVQG
jgi:probable F420-dependent oxidoreductase